MGRFETENANILRYEDFFEKGLRILLRDDKSLHFLRFFLKIGQAMIFSNKVKGENFSFSLGKFETFLDKFLEKSLITIKIRGKILEIKQKIRDLRVENKSTNLNSFNNSMILQSYVEKLQEIGKYKENIEIFEENNEISEKNNENGDGNEENYEISHKNNEISLKNNEISLKNDELFDEKPIEMPIFHKIVKETIELEENFDEIMPEFKKTAHHGLDFIDKNDKFSSEKTYVFPDIIDMPKINLEDDE